jgi:hypothetical protein
VPVSNSISTIRGKWNDLMVKFKGFSNELERRNKKKVKSEVHEKRNTKGMTGERKKTDEN